MKIDEAKIAEALQVTFGPPANPDAFAAGASKILGILRGKEKAGREALIQALANIQLDASNTVIHTDCASLADKLLQVANAYRT